MKKLTKTCAQIPGALIFGPYPFEVQLRTTTSTCSPRHGRRSHMDDPRSAREEKKGPAREALMPFGARSCSVDNFSFGIVYTPKMNK